LATKIRNLYPNRNSIKQPSQFWENEFVFQPIEKSYVYGVLNNLKTNKAVGLHKISVKLLKDSSSVIITPIITNTSSTFPSTWKSGKVTALFKSGDQSNATNYKPIPCLSIADTDSIYLFITFLSTLFPLVFCFDYYSL
jgi:hypothetical protein